MTATVPIKAIFPILSHLTKALSSVDNSVLFGRITVKTGQADGNISI